MRFFNVFFNSSGKVNNYRNIAMLLSVFYKTSNTTIDMGGRLTLNFPFPPWLP